MNRGSTMGVELELAVLLAFAVIGQSSSNEAFRGIACFMCPVCG